MTTQYCDSCRFLLNAPKRTCYRCGESVCDECSLRRVARTASGKLRVLRICDNCHDQDAKGKGWQQP